MWCSCCIPEEQELWENASKNVILNITKVRRLGRKCIVNKQIGRKNVYLENDFVEYFKRVNSGLQILKKLAMDFLLTSTSYEQVHKQYDQHPLRKEFLRLQQHREAPPLQQRNDIQEDEDTEEHRTRAGSSDEDDTEPFEELIRNTFEARLHAQGSGNFSDEEGPSTSHTAETSSQHYEAEVSSATDNSLLETIAVSGAQTIVGRLWDSLVGDSRKKRDTVDRFELLPMKTRRGKKLAKHKEETAAKKEQKIKNKPPAEDKPLKRNLKGKDKATEKPSKKTAEKKNESAAAEKPKKVCKGEKQKSKQKSKPPKENNTPKSKTSKKEVPSTEKKKKKATLKSEKV